MNSPLQPVLNLIQPTRQGRGGQGVAGSQLPGTGLVRPIRLVQSGVVSDCVTWIVIGVACVGGTLAFSIR